MRESLNPKLVIAVIAVVVLLAGGALVWGLRASSASRSATGVVKPMQSPLREQRGPSPEQLKQIEEWKRQNPGKTTQY